MRRASRRATDRLRLVRASDGWVVEERGPFVFGSPEHDAAADELNEHAAHLTKYGDPHRVDWVTPHVATGRA